MVHYQRFAGFMAAVVSAWLCACGGESPPVNGYDPEALRGYCGDEYGRIEQRIDELMAELDLVQKVEQMHGQGLFAMDGVYTTVANERLGIPGFAMVDGPRGVSRSTGTATAFPVSMARGATWDPELEARVGAMIAKEARGRGANVLLAPTINILRHPRWGRAQETYGEDPVHVGAMGSAFIQGAQQHVIATVKHFAVNSIENTRFEVDVTVDPRTLREVYLPHFERAISEAGAGAVMAAYNQVNGAYAAENPLLLRDILKGEWAFQGVVMSDWVFGVHSTVASALAGLDVEMPAAQFYGQPLRTAVQDGQLGEEVVDEAVRRILRAKLCFGLDTNPPVADPALVDTAEAQTLALEVAQRGIVLLDNKGALPIDRAALTSIVVAGPLADVINLGDTGSSDVMPPYAITALAGITEAAGPVAVAHVPGEITDPVNEGLIRDADAVVVVVGLTAADEGESLLGAGDRAELGLPAEQIALIHAIAALSERVIVVVEGGSAITMSDWLGEVEAVLMAWYPGMEGGHAIADILFGDIEPSGRLPVSIPRQEADLPVFDNVATTVSYDYDHGYRHLDRSGVEPLFPFGFGLAYTRFEYASMTVSAPVMAPDGQVTITADITNVGDRAGIETVQLYVSAPASRVQRPTRVLAAFTQVALDPAQTRTVELVVHARDLGFYDMESAAWVVEAIPYELALGSSARTLPLGATVTVH